MSLSNNPLEKELTYDVSKEVKAIAESPAEIQLDYIKHLAINQRTSHLKSLINAGVCIDVNFCLDTPVKSLAKEHNEKAVLYLIEQFNASVDEAVEGAAEIGWQDFAEFLIIEYGASLTRACYGAFKNGDHVWAAGLIARGANEMYAWIGVGAGGHGHYSMLDDTTDYFKKKKFCEGAGRNNVFNAEFLSSPDLAHAFVQGVTRGGHIERFKLTIDTVLNKFSLVSIAWEAGKSGHSGIKTLVEESAIKSNSKYEIEICRSFFVAGAVAGGHYQTAMSLRNEEDIIELVLDALMSKQFKLVNDLFDLTYNVTEEKLSNELDLDHVRLFDNDKVALRSLSLIKNDILRKFVADKTKKKHLLDEANGLSDLIFSKGLSFYQAKAFVELPELTELSLFFISKESFVPGIVNIMLNYIKIEFPERSLAYLTDEKMNLDAKKNDLLATKYINCSSAFYQKYKHVYTLKSFSRLSESEAAIQNKR